MRPTYAEMAARSPVPKSLPGTKIPKKIWICFHSDFDVERKTLEFHGKLSPYVPTEYVEVTDDFEKIIVDTHSEDYNLKVVFKEVSPKFLELVEIWKGQADSYNEDPSLHTSFYNLFANNFTFSE